MVLQVGETTNFIDHSRRVELAFTDPARDERSRSPRDVETRHDDYASGLPVDVEVIEYLKNTDLHPQRAATIWTASSASTAFDTRLCRRASNPA